MDFTDRTAVVTGAGSGIGRATARRLAADGARVVVTDVDLEGARRTASTIESDGGDASVRELDVTDDAAVKALLAEVADTEGLDILVNNAGLGQLPTRIEDTDIETRDRMVSVNALGVWNGCWAAVPLMRETGGGAIVNVSSLAGVIGAPRMATYSLTKAAVLNFTRAVAAEVGPDGIRVNAVCPGFVDTQMVEEFFAATGDPEKSREQTEGMYPLRRLGEPEEIANAIAFLSSEEASFVTGHGLVVDGGYSAY